MPISAALVSTVVLAQAVLAPASAPLAVRLTSDVADCPSSLQVQSALQQVLGDGERSADGWLLSYGRDPSAPAAERGASVLMDLVDPAGQHVAVRRIPASPGDCAAMADAMAAVVERSLRILGWTKGAPLPGSPRRTAEPSAPPVRKQPPRLVLGAGPAMGSSPRTGTNLLLEARVRLAGPLFLRAGGLVLPGSDSQTVDSGTVHLSSRSFTAAPLAVFALGPVELAGGPALLFAVDHGSATNLATAQSGDRMVVAAGAGIGLALALSHRWRLSLGLEGFRVVWGADYFVTLDRKTVVLSPSPWEGIASAKLEFVLWP